MKLKSFDSTEFTASIIQAVNGMLLDMLAAVARKDYEDRRRRQLQGIEKARADGKYAGRKPDLKKRANIASLLKAGQSYCHEKCDGNWRAKCPAEWKSADAMTARCRNQRLR